ncbi:MAG: hypothetical protein RQ866_03260 [Bacteroidales bacterium]|nr:hypothetical protein [Bacteroidales bacterium]
MSYRRIMRKAVVIRFLFMFLPVMVVMPLRTFGSSVMGVDPDDSVIVNNYYHIGFRYGFMDFFGDLDNDISMGIPDRSAAEVFINYGLSPSFTVGYAFSTGSVYGKKRSVSTADIFANHNFKSKLLTHQLRVSYNFGGLYKPPFPVFLQPSVYSGIQWVFFNPMGDLQNKEGEVYHYWSDGTIRNMPDLPENQFTANILLRDYYFETDLRDADLDGFGDYPNYAVAIPVGAMIDININPRLSFSIAAAYNFTFTDYIDNFTSMSGATDPLRNIGDTKNDAFLFKTIGLTFKIWDTRLVKVKKPKTKSPVIPNNFIQFDLNNDNVIQHEEVLKAINDLFDGNSEYDVGLIELLVDWYNIQKNTINKIDF